MHDLAGHDPAPLDLRRLYPAQNGEVAPPSGFAGDITTDISADHATLTYSGPDGKLQYQWSASRRSRRSAARRLAIAGNADRRESIRYRSAGGRREPGMGADGDVQEQPFGGVARAGPPAFQRMR